ncbi:hypothetical protein KAFR_0H00700 [Kazachstania africana CBS 2517]|uniref:PHF5-like protein n=1 Tax=Kazachstania africana (strain ATCC 22294 / BCRC 22015 / CBS 2517 / CECT 1963 / NBRC 1671 / NRRL Y-8276) TaxID=1071382 RepID=H2AYS3_KAZAF|nr:hypothetical protein KAFR_0H00700 [Kazachstania africana CBS 2517]CCF59479.1 hypothetical protein KAFR_0H00700 [Kazachstania africana CBS 2517]
MSRHQFDLVMCMKQPGTQIGLLCDKCDGKCPICDSFIDDNTIRLKKRVRICQTCSFGKQSYSCITCGSNLAHHEAFYCFECCKLEKDKDGCPRIINVGSNTVDKHFLNK